MDGRDIVTAYMQAASLYDRRKIMESGTHLSDPAPYLAPFFAARDAQLRWLRESLERDLCPPWLIAMVLAQWVYVPDREEWW